MKRDSPMELHNSLITLQEQVNLIWLSKVITDIKTLKAKTGISLLDIHDILKNEKNILEQWKKKCRKNNVKSSLHAEEWDGIDDLLLEWIARYKENNITLRASAIDQQVERLKILLEMPSYKLRNKMWYKIIEIFNPQSNNKMSRETSILDPIQILLTYGSRLLKGRIYHKFVGKVIGNNKSQMSSTKKQTEFVSIESKKGVMDIENPIENKDICNDVEIVELNDNMINNGNNPLLQDTVQQQKITKNISSCSSMDFPPLTTINLEYKNKHTKETNTTKIPQDKNNNEDNIGLQLIKNELIDEFLEEDHEFEEFISIIAKEKDQLNTKAIEFATLTNPNSEVLEENEENEIEIMDTVEGDTEVKKQSQDSIYTTDKARKCSIKIELGYNSLQQFIDQQESNEIEILEINEEDIEADKSVYQNQDFSTNDVSSNKNDIHQLKIQENLNTKAIDVENENEIVYDICNDVEILESSDNMINNENDTLLQEPVQQQNITKNISSCSSMDFPPLTTINLEYKNKHTKETNTIKKSKDKINNKNNIGLKLNKNELIDEFLQEDHEFEEFISIGAEEEYPLNTTAIESVTLTNPDLEVLDENEENEIEIMDTVEEDIEAKKQSQDSIYTNDKTEKCSREIELVCNSLQQFIDQQESNEIEILENNEEDIEADESVNQNQDFSKNDVSANKNDIQQLKTQENLNTKAIDVEYDESEEIEIVYEIDESNDAVRSELLDIINKCTNKVSKENSIEVEKEIKIESSDEGEDADVDTLLEIIADEKDEDDNEVTENRESILNDLKLIIENSERQIKLEKNPSRNIDDTNVPSCSSTGSSLKNDYRPSFR